MDSNRFNYTEYIQKRLKEINDLDERKFAKEVLLENLGHIFEWAEEKYDALQQRVQDEIAVPWEGYSIHTTVVDRADYDPTGTFWFPICKEDVRRGEAQGNPVVYLMADDTLCREFLAQGTLTGTEQKSGREICFRITQAEKYQKAVQKLHILFLDNHIPWRAVHMGHIERFFELVPDGDIPQGSHILFQWGKWEAYAKTGMVPLWNVERTELTSREFRFPCMDRAVYEHIFYLEEDGDMPEGYLAEMDGEILSLRYEKGKLLLKTESEMPDNLKVFRLHQGRGQDAYGHHYPVLSNQAGNSFAARYLNQAGNFIQTPLELYRKVEELSGGCPIKALDVRVIDSLDKDMIVGDMDSFTGGGIFPGDRRKVLLFKLQAGPGQEDYLYGSQVRYMLSQMQMEFLEYRCAGVME